MRILIVNPNTPRLDDREGGGGRPRRRRTRHHHPRRHLAHGAASIEGITTARSPCPACWRKSARRRQRVLTRRSSPVSTIRAGCGARHERRAGARPLPVGGDHGVLPRASLHRGDDAGALAVAFGGPDAPLRHGDRARVRAADIPVLELEDAASGALGKLTAEIEAALREDCAEAIVLAVPAWPTSPPPFRPATACPSSTASRRR